MYSFLSLDFFTAGAGILIWQRALIWPETWFDEFFCNCVSTELRFCVYICREKIRNNSKHLSLNLLRKTMDISYIMFSILGGVLTYFWPRVNEVRGLRNRYVVVVVVLGVKPKWNFMHYEVHRKYILFLHLHNCTHLHLCTCIHLHTCVHLHILLRSCNFFHIFIEFLQFAQNLTFVQDLYFLLRFSNGQTKEKVVQIL